MDVSVLVCLWSWPSFWYRGSVLSFGREAMVCYMLGLGRLDNVFLFDVCNFGCSVVALSTMSPRRWLGEVCRA